MTSITVDTSKNFDFATVAIKKFCEASKTYLIRGLRFLDGSHQKQI